MTTEERFNRIEHVLDRIVDTQLQIDGALATLADSHIKTQEAIRDLARKQAETDRQLQAYLTTVRPQ